MCRFNDITPAMRTKKHPNIIGIFAGYGSMSIEVRNRTAQTAIPNMILLFVFMGLPPRVRLLRWDILI